MVEAPKKSSKISKTTRTTATDKENRISLSVFVLPLSQRRPSICRRWPAILVRSVFVLKLLEFIESVVI